MCARHGFFLIWAELAICLVLLLAAAVGAACATAIRHATIATKETTALLLTEEAMEIMKYNTRFSASLPIPETADRNGYTFSVETKTGAENVSGISMKFVQVTVTDTDGNIYPFRCLVGPAEEVTE